jgi:hypothetical protein
MKKFSFLIIFIFSVAAHAEIEKIALQTDTGPRLIWWPKVEPPRGWHFDQGSSYHFAFKAMAPNGSTFSQSETVMYAKASYKPRNVDTTDLASFVKRDIGYFTSNDSTIVVKNEAPMFTGDREKLVVISFPPKAGGNWEIVAYGEESDFF